MHLKDEYNQLHFNCTVEKKPKTASLKIEYRFPPLRRCFSPPDFSNGLSLFFFSSPHHLESTFNARSCPAIKSQCEICRRAGVEVTRRHSLSQTLEPLQQLDCTLPPTAVRYSAPALKSNPPCRRSSSGLRVFKSTCGLHKTLRGRRRPLLPLVFLFPWFLMGRKTRVLRRSRLLR